MCRFLHKSLVDRSIGAQADIVLIEYISLNLCAENRIIRPKKVRGTTSATSNAIRGITAQQKDGLLTLTLYSISRDTPTGTSLFFHKGQKVIVGALLVGNTFQIKRRIILEKRREGRRGAIHCARLGRRSIPQGAMNCTP